MTDAYIPRKYVVHYWLDDRHRTQGECLMDEYHEKGKTIYVGGGRATVRSCQPYNPNPPMTTVGKRNLPPL